MTCSFHTLFMYNMFTTDICLEIAILILIIATLVIISILLSLKLYVFYKKRKQRDSPNRIIGIFHPYCNAGGGGERVLWVAVKALLNKYPDIELFIFTGDEASREHILNKAKKNFNIDLNLSRVNFVYLKTRYLIEHKNYPYFTLILQSLGSMFVGIEAVMKLQPDIYLDTMGYAFTLPIFKYVAGCKTASYVHYPTISTDMLKRVRSRISAHNNQQFVARNPMLSYMKLMYYRFFALLYKWVGRCSDTIMVNSSWTEEHINSIWNVTFKTHRVYPPCDVKHLKELTSTAKSNKIIILSIGQYRPEKDHPLQLQCMYELRTLLQNNETLWDKVKLKIVGSCRDKTDLEYVQNMIDLSHHLSLENSVEFLVNVSYEELVECYKTATIGLHAMWNEHFGIGIVECMAAGLIMVANKSGGPLADIIETSSGSQTGYLASTALEYAQCMRYILSLGEEETNSMKLAARSSVDRFSEAEFNKNFLHAMTPVLDI